MKIILIILSIAAGAPLFAQQPTPAGTETPRTTAAPRRESTPPLISPEVHADRTVTFRLRAPTAREVKVSGEWPGGVTALELGYAVVTHNVRHFRMIPNLVVNQF